MLIDPSPQCPWLRPIFILSIGVLSNTATHSYCYGLTLEYGIPHGLPYPFEYPVVGVFEWHCWSVDSFGFVLSSPPFSPLLYLIILWVLTDHTSLFPFPSLSPSCPSPPFLPKHTIHSCHPFQQTRTPTSWTCISHRCHTISLSLYRTLSFFKSTPFSSLLNTLNLTDRVCPF